MDARQIERPGFYVAIAGPIGVGKSVMGSAIAARIGARLVTEVFQGNLFLERLYQSGGIERWGLACEMSFLPARFDQAMEIAQRIDEGSNVVTDWFLGQNLVYSRITLSDEEYDVYERVYNRLMKPARSPDCLICLHASMDAIADRITRRGRTMERAIDMGYVEQLAKAYRAWEENPPVSCPVLHIDTTNLPVPSAQVAQSDVFEQMWATLAQISRDARR